MAIRRITPFLTLAVLTMLLASSCEKVTVAEGIYGTVKERYGDWMPWLGSNPPDHGERPIACEIYVYEYTRIQDFGQQYIGNYPIESMPKPLVSTTTSNRKGFFQLALTPGVYSVLLVDTDGKLHANSLNYEGGICPVTVEANKASECNLILDHAVY